MKIGSLVELIDDNGFSSRGKREKLPVKGKIYTVRWVGKCLEGNDSLRLEEIVNQITEYRSGYTECSFKVYRFRELQPPMEISLKNILELQLC